MLTFFLFLIHSQVSISQLVTIPNQGMGLFSAARRQCRNDVGFNQNLDPHFDLNVCGEQVDLPPDTLRTELNESSAVSASGRTLLQHED